MVANLGGVMFARAVKRLPKALAMLSGGPPSMMCLSGMVRHSRRDKLRGPDKLT